MTVGQHQNGNDAGHARKRERRAGAAPYLPHNDTAHDDLSSFKLYLNDVRLLTSRLIRGVDLDIINHRAMSNLLGTGNYDFAHAYVFHDGNIETTETGEGHTSIEYLPIYTIGWLDPNR